MTTLYVKNFSCIDEARLRLSRMTVLIGPQASGKSVISKLIYFFYDILSRQFVALEERRSLQAFKVDLADEFTKWFPPSAWGKRKFTIRFEAGSYSVQLTRSPLRKAHPREEVSIQFSPFFQREYTSLLKAYAARSHDTSKRLAEEAILSRDLRFYDRLQSAAETRLRKQLRRDFVDVQLFVPAGRSFFTSLGKAVAAFEHGGILDPVTVRFGRFFASVRDRGWRRFLWRPTYDPKDERRSRRDLIHEFFGGTIRSDREQEYIEAEDGRKIPFSVLSSGQQELLPLLVALQLYRYRERDIVYIEEPEAHLFPATQGVLVEYLTESIYGSNNKKMLITTHSPYVLAKLNILAKAGALARSRPSAHSKIEAIVPSRCWLRQRSLGAYAIIDRKLVSLIDKDGLVDGEYLDDVSGQLARDFSALLEIETS